MSGQELQLGGSTNNPSFVQQGQVDWVMFANSTITGSIAVMQRLSAAGVQPVTVAGGLALGSRLRLGKKGQQNMELALKSLTGIFGYEKVLYYGFGYRSFVNVLTETKVGMNLVALCACLVDMHGIPIAADVLASLWKLERFPEEFEPSLSQFNSLVTACSGVVAGTTFGQTGDIMLGDLRKLRQEKSKLRGLPGGSISNAEDIAKALSGVFEVSRGNVQQINVVGGPNCAFIGALAYWLFDLTVYVQEGNGTSIFQNVLQPETAQVKIKYDTMGQISTELQVASTTYVLADHRQMFINQPWEASRSLTFRTPWDGCLERIFGNAFQKLVNSRILLGQFLGCAARIYAALARAENDVANFSREAFTDFTESTHGYGFIDSTSLVFPELGLIPCLKPAMIKQMKISATDALTKLELTINSLARVCNCIDCLAFTNRHKDQRQVEHDYCVVNTINTINYLVRLVAGMERDTKINPCIMGIQQIYRECCRGRSNAKLLKHTASGLHLFGTLITSEIPSITPSYLLADAERLFSGHESSADEPRRNDYRTALSRDGVCYFLDVLRQPSSNAAELSRIHVIPGHIERGGREYSSVWDCAPTQHQPLAKAKLEHSIDSVPTYTRNDKIAVKSMVTEVSGGGQLIFYYEATESGLSTTIRPGMLTQRVLQRSGLISCNGRKCGTVLFHNCDIVREGWEMVQFLNSDQRSADSSAKCFLWPFHETDLARCVAIELNHASLYIRKGECLPCSTKAAFLQQCQKPQCFVSVI